ncbi:MAG: helix-turn-helix domain-containing protein [Alistipes sp.]|nr:helix-turn-helix domain-containing protein [Alistipes sp.]
MKYLLSLTAVVLSLAAAAATECRFRHYTDANGLSSNTIQSIWQDGKGYVWIGTANGLDRFNSNDFVNFRARCDCGRQLENDCIYAICGENSTGRERIWAGTNDGIFIFDTFENGFERFPLASSDGELRNIAVYALLADASDCMWIATLGAGVFRYDTRSGRTEHFDSRSHPEAFPSDVVPSLLLDNGNHVWLACEQTVSRYNPESGTFSTFRVEDTRQRLAISRVSRLCLDSFGNIWIGGYDSEMFKFEVQQLAFTANRPAKSFGRVRSLIEHLPGVMLLGTDSGLVDFYVENREYRHLDDGTSGRNGRLTDKFVHSILKDRDGGIWIGTYFGGVNYLSPCGMLFSSLEGGEGCGHVISKFCEDADGNIWIGSDDCGLSLYDPRSGSYEKVEIDSAATELNIHALTVDEGCLWVGTYGSGLYRMNLRTCRVRHFTAQEQGLDNLDVYALHRDASHRLWIGTKAGICVYDDESDSISCACPLEYNGDVVDICEDLEGCVWFATMGNGLIRYSYRSDEFDRFPIGGERRCDYVSSLAMGATKLWIGTQGSGLYRYDISSGAVEREFADTGYADCSVFQIVQNGEELWLTTNHGLLQYNYGRRQLPVAYTSDDGLLANIFNFNSGFKSLSGHIYIGSNNGVNRFYPYDFVDLNRTAEPDVVFGDIKFFGRSTLSDDVAPPVDCLRRVEIRGSRVSFSLDFIALNYSSPLRTVYRYRLNNIDKEWITAGVNHRSGQQRVSYSNLSPGRYRFTVSASDDGEHFGRESSVDIVVTAPWWMSNLMRVIYAALFLFGAVAAVVRWRRRVAIEHSKELAAVASKNDCDVMRAKINFVVDAEEEVCEPLSLISAMASELSERGGLPVSLSEEVERIRRNCEVLASRVGRIFDVLASDTAVLAQLQNDVQSPVQSKIPPPSIRESGPWQDADNAAAGRVNVLFVDSNEEYLHFWVRNLSRSFAVQGAGGGVQALQLLHSNRFSAVVCGMMSKSDMDGIALSKAIKTDESYEDIPVILLSSDVSKQLRMRALHAGIDACLPKDVTMDYLSLQIRTLIEGQNRLRFKYSRNPYRRSGADDDTLRANDFMERLNRYVGDNLSDTDMTVDDIAAALRVSRTQLFQRIREIAGTTPNELVRSIRLKRAAELMADSSDLRVSEISYMVGFASVSYFAKCFRQRFGELPNQYMERCRRS